MRLKSFQRLALWTTATTYLLILVGGVVRASGAGLGCPDWPRCFGSWFPPASAADLPPQFDPSQFNPVLMWTEYLNRLLGATVGFLIFATAISAWRHHRHQPRILWTTIAAFLLVGFEGWLGGRVVAHELAAWIVTAHLIVAIVIVQLFLYATFEAFAQTLAPQAPQAPKAPIVIASLIAVTLLQAGFGTQVRGRIETAINTGVARDAALATVGRLDYLHRDLAFIVLIGASLLTLWLLSAAFHVDSLVFRRPYARDCADRPRCGDGVWFAGTGRAGRASNHRQPVVGRGNGVVATEQEAERMRIRVPVVAAACTLGAALFVSAACNRQPAPAPPANQSAHDTHGAAAPAKVPPRSALLGNLGSYHRAIKTSNADAQKFFDEGLTLLYGFNHEESFKSFELAAGKDPMSPMPHWGMSLALGTNINDIAPADRLKQAYTHLAEAAKLKSGGSEVEQGLIDALAKRYVADPTGDQTVREQAYSDAMGALAKKFPEDVDVATLYAESLMNLRPWRLYTKDGTPEPGTDKIVASLEAVMKRDPNHPGANHYYIHAVEASKTPGRAVPQARRLETLVPGAGHLVHMPAHIYIRTGQYAKSARINADAAAVDEKYIAATGANGLYPMMYYTHNVQFESAAAMFAGNLAQARAAAERTVKFADPIADQMIMIEPFAAQDLTVLVRFGQWQAILETKPPAPTRLLQTAVYHFAHGAALAATGKAVEAEADLAAIKAAAARMPKDAMLGPSNSAADVAAIAIADLTARIADAKGDTAAAIKGFTAAVELEDKLGYNEPPDWLNPERERLGAVLLKAGRYADAERVFRADLAKYTDNPRSLYGLYRALEGQKKAAAAEARASFEKAWAGADVTLGDDLYGTRR